MSKTIQSLSVLLDLATIVADTARCTCWPEGERCDSVGRRAGSLQRCEAPRGHRGRHRYGGVSWAAAGTGHKAGCDVQVAGLVLHTCARMLNMDEADRAAAVLKMRRQLGEMT
jgi:hypothetical protein